jgi:hypothetical protein
MKYPPNSHVLSLVTLFGCGSTGTQIAAEVASKTLEAAMRSSERGRDESPPCRDACDAGTYCDEQTNMCVPEQVRTMEDYERAAAGAPISTGRPARAPLPPVHEEDDSCGGYCLESEICRVRVGDDVECIPRPRDR